MAQSVEELDKNLRWQARVHIVAWRWHAQQIALLQSELKSVPKEKREEVRILHKRLQDHSRALRTTHSEIITNTFNALPGGFKRIDVHNSHLPDTEETYISLQIYNEQYSITATSAGFMWRFADTTKEKMNLPQMLRALGRAVSAYAPHDDKDSIANTIEAVIDAYTCPFDPSGWPVEDLVPVTPPAQQDDAQEDTVTAATLTQRAADLEALTTACAAIYDYVTDSLQKPRLTTAWQSALPQSWRKSEDHVLKDMIRAADMIASRLDSKAEAEAAKTFLAASYSVFWLGRAAHLWQSGSNLHGVKAIRRNIDMHTRIEAACTAVNIPFAAFEKDQLNEQGVPPDVMRAVKARYVLAWGSTSHDDTHDFFCLGQEGIKQRLTTARTTALDEVAAMESRQETPRAFNMALAKKIAAELGN